MAVEAVSEKDFEAYVKTGVVLVDFWAPWCGPCRMFAPVFEELSGEMEKVKFAKVDITENEGLAQKHGVMSLPTLILFKDGEEAGRMMGAVSKEHLKQWVEDKL